MAEDPPCGEPDQRVQRILLADDHGEVPSRLSEVMIGSRVGAGGVAGTSSSGRISGVRSTRSLTHASLMSLRDLVNRRIRIGESPLRRQSVGVADMVCPASM